MAKDPANTIGIIGDEDLKAAIRDDEPTSALYRALGVRSEEIWQIMWIAGLIEEEDFYSGHPNYATLLRALTRANELKRARDAA
jgi:hypothetical protein